MFQVQMISWRFSFFLPADAGEVWRRPTFGLNTGSVLVSPLCRFKASIVALSSFSSESWKQRKNCLKSLTCFFFFFYFSFRENLTVKKVVVAKNVSSKVIFEMPVTSVEQMDVKNFLL